MSTFNPAWGNVWKSPWGVVWDSGKSYFTPLHLFENNEKGAWYDFNDLSMLFQDSAGIIPVTANGDPVARNNDKSGNRINMMQTISSKRPVYNADPSRLTLDKVDDALVIVVPTGGWIGTMVLATDEGTASYGVDIPAGNYNLGGEYFPGNAILGVVFRDGAMTTKEKADVEAYFTGNGAMASYGTVVDFANFWRGHSEITEFPLIDTSSGTDFRYAWNNCSSLTSFPLIDTSSGTNFYQAWRYCNSLTSFPLIDTSSGTAFNIAWDHCSALTSFPLIDTSNGVLFSNAWSSCSSLVIFPLLDVSKGTSFIATWSVCSSLTSFPLLDVSSGLSFRLAWNACSSLTSFPLLNVSSGTSFSQSWDNCSSLTSFPANFFDNITVGNFDRAFNNTNLNESSIDGILVSLVTSGIATGTRLFNQSGGSAPSAATGQPAIDTLRSRGWAVTVTGGY